jgi:hypothetical protein
MLLEAEEDQAEQLDHQLLEQELLVIQEVVELQQLIQEVVVELVTMLQTQHQVQLAELVEVEEL